MLFSAPRREITAVAVGADGTIYAADVGDKSRIRCHSCRYRVAVSASPLASFSRVRAGGQRQHFSARGNGDFCADSQCAPRKLWAGKDEIVYQLAATADGLTALTGNRGRIFTIHTDGSYSDVAHLNAQQVVAMTTAPNGWLVATANTGKLYRLAAENEKKRTAFLRK